MSRPIADDSATSLDRGEPYGLAARLVDALREDNPVLARVDTHIEVAAPAPMPRHRLGGDMRQRKDAILEIVAGLEVGARCYEVRLYRASEGWGAVLHCDFGRSLAMREIHRRTDRIESGLLQRFPDLEYALIQAEPGG